MKTRVTVLNENIDAKYRWPAKGKLAVVSSEGQYAMCCLGCEGRARGADPKFMCVRGLGYPSDEAVPGWEEVWYYPGDSEGDIRGLVDTAANTNDSLCYRLQLGKATRQDVDDTVEALREIFREVGEANGERWIIRHIKDDRMFDFMRGSHLSSV